MIRALETQGQAAPAPSPTAERLQQTVREAMEAARVAAQEARVAAELAVQQELEQTPPVAPPAPMPGDGEFNVRLGPDGLVIVQRGQDGTETVTPWNADNMIPEQTTDILLISVLGLIGIIMAFPIGRAIARFIDRRGTVPRVPEDVSRRLGSIEQALDAVAIEVERMSEANRYTTRLLTERVSAPDFRAGAGDPHAQATHEVASGTASRVTDNKR